MPTLLEAMADSASLAGVGFSSTVDASGNSTTTLLADAALREQSPGPQGFAGTFVLRPAATDTTDRIRIVSEFDEQIGGLVPLIAWTNAPASGEVYQVYSFLPPTERPGVPMDWRRLVNRALSHIWTVAEFPCGRGGGDVPRYYPLESAEVVLFAAIAVAGGTNATITPPSGWTLVASVDSTTTLKVAVYQRRAAISDPINWTFAIDSARVASGLILAVVDCNPTTPVDAFASTVTLASTAPTAPSVTTAANDELVLRFIGGSAATVYTAPDPMRQYADVVAAQGDTTLGLTVFGTGTANAGASGAATATSSTAVAAQIGITVALALRSAVRGTLGGGSSVANNGAAGDDEIVLYRPLDLPIDGWRPNREHVRQVIRRRYQAPTQVYGGAVDTDAGKGGRYWRILQDGAQSTLWLNQPAMQDEDVIAVVQRPYPAALVSDGDSTDCPALLLTAQVAVELYTYLNGAPQSRGQYVAELEQAQTRLVLESQQYMVSPAVVM